MKEQSYKVTGMTCSACSAAVQRTVSRMEGVISAEVNLATETLRVSFDESNVNFEKLQATVERAGYGLVAPQVLKRAELGVEGMTCASCSAAVERALKRLDGVSEASVNLATNRAAFSYDPARVKLAQVREAITKAGYTPLDLAAEDTRDAEQEKREKALRLMRFRLIAAIIFSAPILYIAMAHMFPKLGVPLPAFMNPHSFPLVFALVQLVLTIPVLFAGGRFFRVGFKTLLKGSPNMDTLVAIGTGSAFLYGVYATVLIYLGQFGFAQHLYFESAAVVITLVMVGKYLEAV
ncbi:MAG: copper ion binding protein, partial [Clostridiaceae bacterium]